RKRYLSQFEVCGIISTGGRKIPYHVSIAVIGVLVKSIIWVCTIYNIICICSVGRVPCIIGIKKYSFCVAGVICLVCPLAIIIIIIYIISPGACSRPRQAAGSSIASALPV